MTDKQSERIYHHVVRVPGGGFTLTSSTPKVIEPYITPACMQVADHILLAFMLFLLAFGMFTQSSELVYLACGGAVVGALISELSCIRKTLQRIHAVAAGSALEQLHNNAKLSGAPTEAGK